MFRLLQRLDAERVQLSGFEATPLPEGLFVGVVGLKLEQPVWDAGNALRLQPIQPRLGSHEVGRVIKDEAASIVVGRYCEYIGYELAVAPELARGEEALELALNYIALLRVKTLAEILLPAALPCSWSPSTLNRLPTRSCDVRLLEDVPNQIQLEPAREISRDTLDWIFEHLSVFSLLRRTAPSYGLAVDSLSQHTQQHSLRMAAAMLWSGIEALFEIKGEISHRLATYVCILLTPAGSSRFNLFQQVKKHYNIRSRIVHGDLNDDAKICEHIIWTRRILSGLISTVTENQGVPSIETLDRMMLGSEREEDNQEGHATPRFMTA